jgi:hypothetical protein
MIVVETETRVVPFKSTDQWVPVGSPFSVKVTAYSLVDGNEDFEKAIGMVTDEPPFGTTALRELPEPAARIGTIAPVKSTITRRETTRLLFSFSIEQ